LVNAHTHLELSNRTQGGPPASFLDWLTELMGRSPEVADAVKTGAAQCQHFGVTTVGDISKQCATTRPLLTGGPLRVTSYGEVQAMAERRGLLEERFATAVETIDESDRLRVAVSPHAPYSIEPQGYRRCLDFAMQTGRAIATHLAETPDEATFLADHGGPFGDLWSLLNRWDDQVPRFAGGPIRYAAELGLLGYPTLLAHVNYCDDDELAILAAGRASVVYCPRTHKYFGHPPHRWRDMLAAGINVAVGTDSCASSPDLNLVDDLRLLHEIAPDYPVEEIWHMATIRAARAIQWDDELGSIAPGKFADFVVFNVSTDQPLREILEDPKGLPREVWIGGKKI
jgi:aminodeoxyfutalosine deaminase